MFGDFLRKVYEFRKYDLEALHGFMHRSDGSTGRTKEFRIEAEISLNFMFKEVESVISVALGKTAKEFQERVNPRPPLRLTMIPEGRKIPTHKGKRYLRPDWPVYYTAYESPSSASCPEDVSGTELPRSKKFRSDLAAVLNASDLATILATTNTNGLGIVANGEAKRTPVFNTSNLINAADRPKVKNILGQLMMYCYNSDTRYGFVLNSECVTLLRFFKLDKGVPGKDGEYGVHYAILPWKRTKGLMSAQKGIWILSMMGCHDKHKSIVTQDQIRDLNDWAKFQEGDQVLWANHLSKIIVADSEAARNFNRVDAPRDEFAAELDQYLRVKAIGLGSKRKASEAI
ncbi:hypothetical protein PG993_014972 [Apiospora rasikravindrae]|uniref:Uncharacterized protein n=1 Tax=Apiospora rasikravindrae TaxID=990691 RepID=A0ABR1RPA5_9PEZI